MTTPHTSGAADLPEALRPIHRFEVVDCIDSKHVPAVIPNPHGPWVRYEDHVAALAAGQAVAPADEVARIVHLRSDRNMRIYIAGPMTGLPEFNFPLFNATAKWLRHCGWHVENPAEHGHVEGAGWADYLRWDISRIVTCGAIYLLPGWSQSKGATLEVHIAGVLGLQVLYADGAETTATRPAPPAMDGGEDAARNSPHARRFGGCPSCGRSDCVAMSCTRGAA